MLEAATTARRDKKELSSFLYPLILSRFKRIPLEAVEMLEVKQGTYVGEQDKTRFQGITAEQAKIIANRESSP